MSLLDDVSIVVTPNGYKAGELYAVIPVPTEGAEEVTNGGFATDTDWTKGTGWTISGGSANSDGANSFSSLSQASVLTIGKRYKLIVDINLTSGQLRIQEGGAILETYTTTGANTATYYFIATATNITFKTSVTPFNGSIDNVSVKEYTAADMDVTRETAATRVDENGLIEDVLSNVPRIDYSGCPHILAEPQRTNNIQYSEDFTQSYWRKDKVTVTANSIISLSGQLDTSLIQETVYTGGIPSFDLLSSITLGTGSHTFTFYVKNNNGRYLGISFGSNAQRVRTNFDFTTNTFKTLIFNGTTTGSASFTTLGDYYRISITATFPSSTVADTVLMPLATDTYPFYSFQDSDNRSFYLWGAQLEVGSYGTSYIPTSGSTVTRNQDLFTRDGIGSLINSTEGVLFLEIAALSNDSTRRAITLSDGTTSNRVMLRYQNSSNAVQCFINVAGALYSNLNENSYTITDFLKIAFKWKAGDFALWINGTEVAVSSDATSFGVGVLTELQFNEGDGAGSEYFGKVKQLQVYKTALTDVQLAALTT